MKITITYPDGKAFTMDISEDAFNHTLVCSMDDVSTNITWMREEAHDEPF